ncbi:protein-export chaperone SecB [Empedobacter stercoris]|uniref:protein-export chaperone SecB n=1 Tax=Empedobacter stercoris TaxID=1628248 RepID=UPI001CE12A60|nr:protein-export chaperone SecB [Empedobacter stercoris]MCA4782364.1 protein-export chaperone SecB [Empedobacter stercoris]
MEKTISKFRFTDFKVTRSIFNFIKDFDIDNSDIAFDVKGTIDRENNIFYLFLGFVLKNNENEEELNEENVHFIVESIGEFEFDSDISTEDLSKYFLTNSTAIMFPYIRSYITTLTSNSGFGKPIILPTMNLTSLKEKLEANISEI